MAGISVDSKTSSSFTVYVSGLDTSWSNGTRTVYWYRGSAGGGIPTPSAYSQKKTASLANKVSSGGSVTFTGLSAGTQYGVYCEIYHGSTLLTPNGLQGYVTTDYEDSGGTSITKWDWYASNGSNASASQTISAYNAINGTGTGRNTKNFSHSVWNDMVDKVKEICDEAVGWWDTDYATYYNTKFNSTPYELTADMFNSLRNNLEIAGYQKLSLGYKTGIGQVFSGDTVYGDYFLTLAEYMNSCIDNL